MEELVGGWCGEGPSSWKDFNCSLEDHLSWLGKVVIERLWEKEEDSFFIKEKHASLKTTCGEM